MEPDFHDTGLVWAQAIQAHIDSPLSAASMEMVIYFTLFALWTMMVAVAAGAGGWLAHSCMESKTSAVKMKICGKGSGMKSSKPCKPSSDKGRKGPGSSDGDVPSPPQHSMREGTCRYRGSSPARDVDASSSNLGFDLVSEPPEPVLTEDRAAGPDLRPPRRGYVERDMSLVTMWHTNAEGTMLHTNPNCGGLRARKNRLISRKPCSICCSGVEVVPFP